MAPLFLFYELSQLLIVTKKGWIRHWWQSLTWIVSNLPKILSNAAELSGSEPFRTGRFWSAAEFHFAASLPPAQSSGPPSRSYAIVVSYWKVAGKLI